MKFTCEQNTLTKALNIVSKAVTSRTTINILKGILIIADEQGYITMRASDLDISIEDKFEADIIEPGEIVVQAKLFGDIIRKLPSGNIEFVTYGDTVNIKGSYSDFNILGTASDEFPKFNITESSDKVIFDKEILKNMIKQTTFAASIDESRGVITGVLTELTQNYFNMIALDGFRMAITREPMQNSKEDKIIIPAKILNEISKIISETETETNDVIFYMSEKRAVFIIDEIKVVLRILDGEFVKYNDILPKEFAIKVALNRSYLLQSIERASLFAKVGKNNLVRLEIKDNMMSITSKSEEGNVKEEIPVSKEGKDLIIGFNSKYLMDSVKVIEDDNIIMLFNTAISPCLIRPLEGNSYEHLVLPVRISAN